MTLLSDRYNFDRLAGKRAEAGLRSLQQGNTNGHYGKWTIHEACDALEIAYPVSDADLRDVVQMCDTWGVETNVSDESWWKALQHEGRQP